MSALALRGSIRRRLVLQLSGVAALLAVVFFFVVRSVAENAAEKTQDDILAASATAIADALRAEAGAVTLDLPYSALSMLGTLNEDRVFYRILVGSETLTGYDDLPIEGGAFATFPFRGETVRAAYVDRPVWTGSAPQNVRVAVAQTRRGMAAISSRITGTATGVAIAFFVLAAGLSLLATRSAFAPFTRMTQSVTRRGPSDLRPIETDLPSELVPLAGAINGFMARLGTSLRRSEEFIAEAAHRVRTPLATVRTQAEITHRKLNKPEHKAAIRGMIRAVDESSRSAGQMLDHAMVTFRTDSLETATLDLRDLVEETCERLAPTADLKDIRILRRLPEEAIPFEGDRVLLQSALRNILDNAIKYSPADSDVSVIFETGGEHRIAITDAGRGFAGTEGAALTPRFARGSNVGDIVGSGLGLTIADEVARAHGGRLEIAENSEGTGACVALLLPSG
ncbi:sensor histidine kinase N-terminal domain-containing protein [Pseudaestuariivita sp.]|uniref:sensor histidine kinase N-terminal domain-containing protein n=1 Tax=Pseudaestuariivita sp. TaxID=2211669 RepID=UPI004058B804